MIGIVLMLIGIFALGVLSGRELGKFEAEEELDDALAQMLYKSEK